MAIEPMRELVNKNGEDFDENKTDVLFAEDYEALRLNIIDLDERLQELE